MGGEQVAAAALQPLVSTIAAHQQPIQTCCAHASLRIDFCLFQQASVTVCLILPAEHRARTDSCMVVCLVSAKSTEWNIITH